MMRVFANVSMIVALAASVAPALPAQVPASAPAAPAGADEGYVLGTGDVVEVSVLGRDDFRARVRVQTDGAIQLPLIGRTEATGRTALQLGEQIRKALRGGGYFANPVVSVDIATYASRYVVVLGEVGQPGLVPVDRSYRVSEILARVGGAKASAADDLTLRRESGEERQLAIVKLATGGREDDPQVNPGDKLYLPAAKTYYIYGQVNAPGNYKLDTSMTLRQAIARGGGLTAAGSEKRARVYRDGKELKKYSLNDLLQPGDTVVVGERFF